MTLQQFPLQLLVQLIFRSAVVRETLGVFGRSLGRWLLLDMLSKSALNDNWPYLKPRSALRRFFPRQDYAYPKAFRIGYTVFWLLNLWSSFLLFFSVLVLMCLDSFWYGRPFVNAVNAELVLTLIGLNLFSRGLAMEMKRPRRRGHMDETNLSSITLCRD